jgi:hypothetical protein
VQLTLEDARRLHQEAPGRLAQLALESRQTFAFEPKDMRADGGEAWGGEVRVCVNGNVVLHFVPRFNREMERLSELPQFVVMPSVDDRDGADEVHTYDADGELDAFDGVVFWVSPEHYADMLDELREMALSFPGRCLLPDALFGDSRFVHFVKARVLEHPIVHAERAYDFSKRVF